MSLGQVRKPKIGEDDGDDVPLWLVSFTDMITLLLSFFVLLLSLALPIEKELFHEGQGSFNRAIRLYGIPYWLEGRPQRQRRSFIRKKYTMEEDPNDFTRERVLDAVDEQIREVFDQIRREIETEATDFESSTRDIFPTTIRFSGANATLSPAARQEAIEVANRLQSALSNRPTVVYVIGLAPDAPEGFGRWAISARRARSVESVLRTALASKLQRDFWKVRSLGAASARQWRRVFDAADQSTQVFIAVTGAE